MYRVNPQDVFFERDTRQAQATLQASHLGDTTLQHFDGIGIVQELPSGLCGDQLTGERDEVRHGA